MGGHSGINSTSSKISNFLWKCMKEDIVEHCKVCDCRQRYEKLKTMAPELKCIKVSQAMELVGMNLIGIENLPYELQRNFTLMRDLDQRTQDLLKEIDGMANQYMESVRTLSPTKKTEKLKKLEESFAKAKELSDDKVQLAMQTYEMVDKHIRKLDFDLARFEADLKEQHEQEVAASEYEEESDPKSRKRSRKSKGRRSLESRKKRKSMEPVMPTLAAVTAFLPSPDVQVLDMPVDPNEPTYCLCHQVSYGEMIGCDNTECPIEWFHFPCVGLTTKPKGKWFCPKCSQEKKKK